MTTRSFIGGWLVIGECD